MATMEDRLEGVAGALCSPGLDGHGSVGGSGRRGLRGESRRALAAVAGWVEVARRFLPPRSSLTKRQSARVGAAYYAAYFAISYVAYTWLLDKQFLVFMVPIGVAGICMMLGFFYLTPALVSWRDARRQRKQTAAPGPPVP